jgi:hypothetical protein
MNIEPPKDKAERDSRLDLVMATIEANPRHWDQSALWHCGTSHCFAGIAQCLAVGLSVSEEPQVVIAEGVMHIHCDGELRRPPDDACEWLALDEAGDELDLDISEELFETSNDLDDLRRIVQEIKSTDYTPPGERR